MRAVSVAITAEDRSFEITDHPEPQPQHLEVLVAVHAFSLNNGEVRDSLKGAAGHRPGVDFAGIVEAAPVGSNFMPGDRVFGLMFGGSWAERIAVAPEYLAPIPDGVSIENAAALPAVGLTASVALGKKPISHGERLLVTAATGGVGMAAIQLGKLTGAHVTALVRDLADADLLRRLGADVVADADGASDGEPYDLIVEGVGGQLLGRTLEWLAPRGMCVQLGDAAGDEPTTFDAKRFRLKDGGLFGGTSLYGLFLLEEFTRPEPLLAAPLLRNLAEHAGAGRLDPVVNRTASWRDLDAVARAYLRREFNGKAVLFID